MKFLRKLLFGVFILSALFSGCDSGHKHSFSERAESAEYLKSEATCTQAESYYFSCKCGAKGEEVFSVGAALGHDFTAEIASEEYLKEPATCRKKAVYVKACVKCGQRGYNVMTFSYGELGEHQYTEKVLADGYLKTAATATEDATYYYSCACGEKGAETFTKREIQNRNVLIFGDSYSTFKGYIPNGYDSWYPKLNVDGVEKTWWKKFLKETDSVLVQNNSWSGSTIGYTGYNNNDCSKTSSFIYRYRQLKEQGFFEKNRVDTVFVFGGANDDWAGAPLGQMQFSGWSELDLYQVLPAVCYLTYTLKNDLPNAEIVLVIDSGIKKEIQDGIEEAAKYYGVSFVRLKEIEKKEGHPTDAGMTAVYEQILFALQCGN